MDFLLVHKSHNLSIEITVVKKVKSEKSQMIEIRNIRVSKYMGLEIMRLCVLNFSAFYIYEGHMGSTKL